MGSDRSPLVRCPVGKVPSVVTVRFARHWRPEFAEVAGALRAIGGARANVVGGGRLSGPDRHQPDLLVLSDPPATTAGDATVRIPTARLWWNDASEVNEAAGLGRIRADELHVAFFPETAAAFRLLGHAVVEIPYAFTAPVRIVGSRRRQVTYTGEVDTSDACFAGLPDTIVREFSAIATDLAAEVAAGDLRLTRVATTDSLQDGMAAEQRDLVLWAVRNRVRHRIVEAIVRAFPRQVYLRGTDWRHYGFEASPTPFRRITRRRSYRRSRSSLDLGAKSGNAVLSPRSAEIMAVGGNIVQFDSGAPIPDDLTALAGHMAASAPALVDVIGRDLDADAAAAHAARSELQAEYRTVRETTSLRLLDALLDHLARA